MHACKHSLGVAAISTFAYKSHVVILIYKGGERYNDCDFAFLLFEHTRSGHGGFSKRELEVSKCISFKSLEVVAHGLCLLIFVYTIFPFLHFLTCG